MPKIIKFKEGEIVQRGARFLYSKKELVKYEYLYPSCGCPGLLGCGCAEETWERFFWYEVDTSDDIEENK